MPFCVLKFSASPETKPLEIETVAPLRLPPLSLSLSVRPLSSVTALPPPLKVTDGEPAVTTGATCATVQEVEPVLLVPLLLLPSDTTQLSAREVALPPLVGSRWAVKL